MKRQSSALTIARRPPAPKTIDEYIDRCAPQPQPILRRVRATIAKAAPDATETISYGIPAFKLRRIVVYFAAFKQHIGLYPPVKRNAALEKAKFRPRSLDESDAVTQRETHRHSTLPGRCRR